MEGPVTTRAALPASEEPMFCRGAGLERRSRGFSLAASVAAHAAAVILIPAAANLVSWVDYNTADRAIAEPLRVRAPFYFVPGRTVAPPAPGRAPDSRPVPTASARPRPGRLQLPIPQTMPEAPPLLQPKVVRPSQANLPPILAWAREQAIPRPAYKSFVVPGRTEKPAKAPDLDAPPSMAIPSRQARNSALEMALAAAAKKPALPVPNGSPHPVRDAESGGGSRSAALDPLPGDAAHIISLGSALGTSGTVTVPAGAGNGTMSNGSGLAGSNGPGSGADRGAGASGADAAAGGGAPAAPPPPIRIDHAPSGSFDVVITQSAPPDDTPDAAALLSGNPVYVVYLPVGDGKDWLLEFCAPTAAKPRNQYEISIDAPAQITPPYPIVTVVPGGITSTRRPKHIVLHGYLTQDGGFRDVKLPAEATQLAREVALYVKQWRFRPATRDRVSIEVEVLLVVPPRP